jgi:4-amino-4-deoxy-L-arabinose transferase-like glycosyltransferase
MRPSRLSTLLFVLVLALAAWRLWRSPYSAANLEIGPDSIEYTVAAGRFVDHQGFNLLIAGVTHPPRYTPWFSVGLLAPFIYAARGELGAAILPVFLLSLVSVGAAFIVGKRLAGEWGAAGAAIALLLNPVFAPMARVVMTDVPALAFGLLGCWLFLRPGTRRLDALWAGLAAGAGFALRSECLAILIPFAWRYRRSGTALALLAAPSLLVAVGTGWYNAATFGNWLRSGYDYWCPVPYEVPGLTFGLRYLAQNLERLLVVPRVAVLLFGAAGAAWLLGRRREAAPPALSYLALAALPGTLLHLVYFYPEARFHLFVLALASILGGAAIGSLADAALRGRLWPIPIVVVVAAFVPRVTPLPPPYRRIAAETMARETPKDAVIVSGLDPVFLSPYLLRDASRTIVPASRSIEYADKLVAPAPIGPLDPPARGPDDHRAPGLRRAGAVDPCPIVATESRERLVAWLDEGRRVFIDAGFLPQDASLDRILDPARVVVVPNPKAPWLGELRRR